MRASFLLAFALALTLAAAANGGQRPIPTPVGVGPRYQPSAAGPMAASTNCQAGALTGGQRVHLELFADDQVVIVPAGIGLAGARLHQGQVSSARCHQALWTTTPTGVVHFSHPATLGRLFAVWGRRLEPQALLSFPGAVRVYVNGHRRLGDPRLLQLRDRQEVVVEVGAYVPPHRFFLFPPR